MKEFILEVAKEVGELAMEYLGKAKVSDKGPKDVITEADLAVEKLIIKKIREKYPGHNIVAEESTNKNSGSRYRWYIDPIDGTHNYAHGDPNFVVSIGVTEDGELKYACINFPYMKDMYYAEKGKGTELNGKKVRVSRASTPDRAMIQLGISPLKDAIDGSLKLFRYFTVHYLKARDYGYTAGQMAFVASGKADGYLKIGQHPWDVAAGILIIEEAGGKVTDFKGNKIKLGGKSELYNLVASNGLLHDQLLKELDSKELKSIDKNKTWY